jgi:hypothetical protein
LQEWLSESLIECGVAMYFDAANKRLIAAHNAVNIHGKIGGFNLYWADRKDRARGHP